MLQFLLWSINKSSETAAYPVLNLLRILSLKKTLKPFWKIVSVFLIFSFSCSLIPLDVIAQSLHLPLDVKITPLSLDFWTSLARMLSTFCFSGYNTFYYSFTLLVQLLQEHFFHVFCLDPKFSLKTTLESRFKTLFLFRG